MESVASAWATEDHYALFRRYLDSRHADGGMADMDMFEFAAMIEESPIRSRLVEYTPPPVEGERGRQLIAACLTDILDDGLSLVYSFYDPDMQRRSLGTQVILDHVELARSRDQVHRHAVDQLVLQAHVGEFLGGHARGGHRGRQRDEPGTAGQSG